MKRKNNSIKLSPKYGVNPSLLRCECCGKDYGVALLGKLKKDEEAPHQMFQGLCNDCQAVIDAEGVLIIEVKDGETGDNPYRTGRFIGLNKNFKEDNNINSQICYMEKSLFSSLFKDVEFK